MDTWCGGEQTCGGEDHVDTELRWTQRPGHREEEEPNPQISRPEVVLDSPRGHPTPHTPSIRNQLRLKGTLCGAAGKGSGETLFPS